MSRRSIILAAVSGLALSAASAAWADSTAYTKPNVVSTTGATSVTLGGATFVNQGLVGTARLSANLHDFNGETLGSFSGMSIDLKTWRRSADGGYTATLYTLPDRGPNNVGGLTTTNYAARLNKFSLTLNPYTGATALASNVQQGQLTQSGGVLLRDTTGQTFTGRDPQAGVVVRDGIVYPSPPAGDVGAGKISLDAEAVTFLGDGSFYVGDEYGAAIYYFDASGRQIGAIQATPDVIPKVNGQVNFNGTNDSPLVAGSTGRRSNQGMEGISVSPDGTRLFAVLQSAPLQDNPTNTAVRRNNTRVLVYDISATKTPTTPIAEYVLQLPVYNNSKTGTGSATATAAQSEILALNNTQFLVLSRDGNGRGTNGNTNAFAFKSVLLVDVAGATNIAGTAYAGTTPVSTTAASNGSGALSASITPVQQVELVNMLNPAQLSRFGLNLNPSPSTQYTLSEKWEAMGLAPVLEEDKPHDFFLLVGNDNDFVSSDVDAAGVTNANTSLTSATGGTGDNDNVILFYRLTLPTYIDPEALAYLRSAAPIAISGARVAGARIGAAASLAGVGMLNATRRARFAGAEVGGYRAWGQGALERVATSGAGKSDGWGLAAGVESGTERLRFGLAVAGSDYDGDDDDAFAIGGHSYGGGLYAGLFDPSGFYLQGSVSGASLRLDTTRPAAYGLTARGRAKGDVLTGEAEIGYSAKLGGFRAGPFVDVLHSIVDLDRYTEHGASVGNGTVEGVDYRRTEATIGLEAVFAAGPVRPSLRGGYTLVDENGDTTARVSLAAVQNSGQTAALPHVEKSFARIEGALEGEWRGFSWRAGVEVRDTDGDASGRVTLGLSKAF